MPYLSKPYGGTGRAVKTRERILKAALALFNERGEAFCMVTGSGDIVAANGGSTGGSCAPPPGAGIDWIFGTSDVTFSDYVRYQDGFVQRTTDHPVIEARATITEPLP